MEGDEEIVWSKTSPWLPEDLVKVLGKGMGPNAFARKGQQVAEVFELWIEKKEEVGDVYGKLIVDGHRRERVYFSFPEEVGYESAFKRQKVVIEDLRMSLDVPYSLQMQDTDVSYADGSRDKSPRRQGPMLARISGPNRAMTAADSFDIDLELENDRGRTAEKREWVSWNTRSLKLPFDRPLEAKFSCELGDVSMKYVVMDDAAEAYVDIFLSSKTGPAWIHGEITVKNDFGKITMFKRDASEIIEVRAGVPIPLSRRTICVPADTNLTIIASLHDSKLSSSNNIAQGSAELLCKVMEMSSASIKGELGEIEVRVKWLNAGCSPDLEPVLASVLYPDIYN